MKAIVLGAGPSGISLAWFLSKNNWEVELIEKQSFVGGLGSSREKVVEGKKIFLDNGPHIFHTKDQEMIEIWKSNFSEIFKEQILFAANCKGKNFSEFHDYPISKEGLKKQRIEFLNINNSIDPFKYSNYRDYMKSRVGSVIEELYFRKYPKKLWGIETDKMRADWAPKRIEVREKIEPFFANQWVGTSDFGSGFVYKDMQKTIIKNKGKIFLNTTIKKFRTENTKITKLITNNGEKEINDNSIIISCLPTAIIGNLLNNNFKCNYRGVIIISALHSKKNLHKDYSWIYFDNEEIIFTRVTNFSKLSPSATNDLNIYMYEIPFDGNQQIDEKELLKNFKKSLKKISWLEETFIKVIDLQIERFVYPIREMGYEKNVSKIHAHADSLDNLIRSGTSAEFEYGDVQICFRKSLDLANDLINHPKVKKLKSPNQIKKIPVQIKNIKERNTNFAFKDSNKVKFIAEIGLNHNGNIDMAKKLIDISAKAKCDYVKLQLYSSDTRANKYTRDAFYKEDADGEGENLYEIFKRCELKFEDMQNLYSYSKKAGVDLFFSAFDRNSVRSAFQINPDLLKISSMDLTNFEVCDEASKLFTEIIMSTGMSTIKDIKKSSEFLKRKIGDNLTLLHCVSSYPMDINSAALGTINFLKKFAPRVGYSDHSLESFTSILAVSHGAEIIEKHITLDKKLSGPDHSHSLEENELVDLVSVLHNYENITNVRSGLIGVEHKEYMRQKKGYYYKADMHPGEILNYSDLLLMPPCLGDDTFEISEIIGKKILFFKKKLDPVLKKDCEL